MKIPESLRWNYIRDLGDGGQGIVALVGDMTGDLDDLKKRFALKRLKNGQSEKAYQRFVTEIEAIKKLDHPNIIKIIDHSQPDDEFQYYVMEYIEGARPLKKLMDTNANPFYKNAVAAVDLFIQLTRAIDAWKDAGIVHRDLSPANILVLPDQTIKVIDFGICQIEGGAPITLVDEGLGSRNYTAPECETGGEGNISVVADIYSAGKILWSAITNEYAFAREKPAFATKSMLAMFEDKPEIWHLQKLFEHTIRHEVKYRFLSGMYARHYAKKVRKLIAGGYMPLQKLQEKMDCPVCGWGFMKHRKEAKWVLDSRSVIHGDDTFAFVRCDHCGLCLAVDQAVMAKQLEASKDLA
jgi:serine/threonine protein kinase